MNKAKAKEKAWEGMTAGELRQILRDAKFDPNSKATLNPGMTKAIAMGIFENALRGVEDDVVFGPSYSVAEDRKVLSKGLIAYNVLREFG